MTMMKKYAANTITLYDEVLSSKVLSIEKKSRKLDKQKEVARHDPLIFSMLRK